MLFFPTINERIAVFMGVIVEFNNSDLFKPNNKDNFCVVKKLTNSTSLLCEKSVKPEAKFCDLVKEDKCVKDYLKNKMKGLKKLKKKMGFGKLDCCRFGTQIYPSSGVCFILISDFSFDHHFGQEKRFW